MHPLYFFRYLQISDFKFRTSLFLAAVCFNGLLCSQEPAAETQTTLPEVVVEGKARPLLGVTDTASKGVATQEDFLSRPLLRRGEILETIPGMVITQ
ncbi:MAG TPA: hypothetical protein DIT64_05950, partial [Verrucomicrobiales bacterium]|nr:hypothetical protein [Verrucomicrobiales bacterium]